MNTFASKHATVLKASVDMMTFDPYRSWLDHHCSHGWRVRYIEQTGVRTVVVFDSERDKFMFDIAWADSVTDFSPKIALGNI